MNFEDLYDYCVRLEHRIRSIKEVLALPDVGPNTKVAVLRQLCDAKLHLTETK
jgi:hypothetical protein